MRKLALVIGTLFLSMNVLAATPHDLGLAVKNAMNTHRTPNMIKTAFPMIYGGQDISHPIVATANESIWAGQQSSIVG